MDSVLVAHVAKAITAVTGDDDYGAVAERAARLLRDYADVMVAARDYASGELSAPALQACVAIASFDAYGTVGR